MSQQPKSNHETSKEQEIHRKMHETSRKRKQEEKGKKDSDGGDDFGVDEALLAP